MLDNNKVLSKNTVKTFFVWRRLLPLIDTNFYFGFRPEIKLRSMLNFFEPIMICLEKLRLQLNFFGSAHFNQNNTDIRKVEDNKITKNSK